MICSRRAFLETLSTGGLLATTVTDTAAATPSQVGPTRSSSDVATWRREFPSLGQQVNGFPLTYLDSAATTLRPKAVIASISQFYESDNANPGATLHTLARRAAQHYGDARTRVASFLNAADASEIVFTKGTTEGINLVAASWGVANLQAGDDIVLSVAEHYSNLLPWRALSERVGARIRVVDVDNDGRLSPTRVAEALTDRTRLVAFSHVSNVLGLLNPAEEICQVAKRRGARVLIDAAQSAPHIRLDVRAIGCDFLACSAHKMLGPMGVGVLWARGELLEAMPPYQYGSNMAHDVGVASGQLEHRALKFQAGTPNVSGPVGLAAALDLLDEIGIDAVALHDRILVEHFTRRSAEIEGLRVLGTLQVSALRLPVFTFTLKDIPIARIVSAMDARGIAIRGGDMAALPLLKRFGVSAAARASCYLYTTTDEVDRFVDGLVEVSRGAGMD